MKSFSMSIHLIIMCFMFAFGSNPNEISVIYDSETDTLIVKGLTLESDSVIREHVAVYFGNIKTTKDSPKVIGNYETKGSTVFYKPKYGFSMGSTYTVVINQNNLLKSKEDNTSTIFRKVIKIPVIKRLPTTYVDNVYPTSSELPMNQLKLYIEFSSPMQMGKAYKYIKLYRMPDEKLETDAFISMAEELWDSNRQRLTLFFDPGRIKRGVQPNLQLGLPLVEGRRYKLVIKKEWLDINGAFLLNDFVKEFQVVNVDRKSPNWKNWNIISPTEGTREPLVIDFKESMDYGLLHSAIVIINGNQIKLPGTISLSDCEKKWYFKPVKTWSLENYEISINAWLEDLAGNNLKRKFDVNLNDPEDLPKKINEIVIPFNIIQKNNKL